MGRKHQRHRGPATDESKASRYAFLFCALLAHFALVPFIREGGVGEVLFDLLILVVLLGSVPALADNRWRQVVVAILALGLLAAPSWGLLEPSMLSATVASISVTGIFGVLVVVIAKDVYEARRVTFGTLLGACSAYILLGLFWFGVFGIIDLTHAGSYNFTEIHAADMVRIGDASEQVSRFLLHREQLFYFSFVTLTTLGYGDITPVSQMARVYATLNAITGQLFIAILVARLVGLQLAGVMSDGSADPDVPES